MGKAQYNVFGGGGIRVARDNARWQRKETSTCCRRGKRQQTEAVES